MKTHRTFLLCSILLLHLSPLKAQENETSLFGSLQLILFNQKSHLTFGGGTLPGGGQLTEERSSFAIQQMDLFLQKHIGEDFTAFFDLEFQLNYSSEQQWGAFSIQEAWLHYAMSDAVGFKIGMLYPAFNNLNEIKNRLALLPYIFRPGVYERLLSDLFLSEDYIPERAYVQIQGGVPYKSFFFDYAVYAGNAEGSYISTPGPDGNPRNDLNSGFEFLTGVDPTEFNLKLFGGRAGIRARDEQFKAGISFTHDYDNLRDTTSYPLIYDGIRGPLRGDARRMRIGGDVSGRIGPVRFEVEGISVLYDHPPAEERGIELSMDFAYAMVGYAFGDALFVYGSYEGGTAVFGQRWTHQTVTAGAAYQISPAATVKAQYILYRQFLDEALHQDESSLRFVFLGLSLVL
ncbi:MAG: hypothetical protein JXA28_07705 [Bacteroidetes bacterium]|nr:hypothetical protein [Bacteroidota bacterium]